jgi:hypothetical protein
MMVAMTSGTSDHRVTYFSTQRFHFVRRFLALAVLVAASSIATGPAAHAACIEPPVYGGPAGNSVHGDPSTVGPDCGPKTGFLPSPNSDGIATQGNPPKPDSVNPSPAQTPTSSSSLFGSIFALSWMWPAFYGLLVACGLSVWLLAIRRLT